jgi:hypothetical protein
MGLEYPFQFMIAKPTPILALWTLFKYRVAPNDLVEGLHITMHKARGF